MSYIFGKLWHSAIIWPIRKSFKCILPGVRFLLAKQTRLSGTSDNMSHIFPILEETVLNIITWNFGVCSKSEPRFLQRRRQQYLEDLAFSSGSRIYIKRCICLADKAGWLPSGFAEIWHFMQRLFRGRLLWNTGNGKSLDCGKTIPRSSTASKFSSLDKDRKRWNSINYFLDKKSADIQRGSCRVRVQTFSQANCSVLTADSF